jgi:hypothetical protein
MRFLKHNQIDFEKWDNTILNSDYPWVFAQSFYLNSTSPGWHAIVHGNYEAVMPLTWKKKMGIEYLTQPPFTPQLGIFGKGDDNLKTEFNHFINSKFSLIDIECNPLFPFIGKEKRTFVIENYNPSKYNENTRRNINKALKNGLSVEIASDKEIRTLYENTMRPFLKDHLKIPSAHIKLFNKLLESSAESNSLQTFIVVKAGEVKSLGYFISNHKHAVYLKGTNSDKNSGSMHLLIDYAIRYFLSNGVKYFDFGGGENESLARFYSGFGAFPFIYHTYKFNRLPFPLNMIKK